jgi:N-methylhydantoinase B
VDIIENALRNARVEMDAVLFRTAMSPGIREQGDCFPMVANKDGKMVVGQFGSFIYGFMEAYEGELEEGDVILTNDPYMCNAAVSHLPDWIVLVPIFKDGRHLAWSAMMVPGSIPIKAETIFQEGIRIPPTKLYKKGELQVDVLELILHNVRTPNWNRFDLNALVAACKTAARRCIEMAERFGDDVFYSTMEIMLERNYMAMKAIIEMIVPEEPRVFEDYVCDDGVGMGPYKIRCKLWREGSKAIFDFAGTDPPRRSCSMTASTTWWRCVSPKAPCSSRNSLRRFPGAPMRLDASSTSWAACWGRARQRP